MAETLAPVAPPSEGLIEKVTPAVPGASRPVAKVELEYPPRFQQIVQDLGNAADPKAKIRIADNVAAHEKETQEYRPNQKTQWDKVLVNVLSRNYNEALKWFNGGGVVEREAKDVNNNLYWREENDFGFTGRIKDSEGKYLTPQQMKDLNSRGGIFTSTDEKSLKTAPWVNGKYNAELANKGLTSQLQLATNDAYNAARTASSSNQNIDDQLNRIGGLKNVLDHISSLPTERRQKLLGYVNRLNQITTSAGTTSEKGLNVNAGGQQTVGGTAGANVGTGATGTEGGVPPPGAKIGAGANVGASTSATTQAGASGREANIATSSGGTLAQEQQTLQAAIMQELQGVIQPSQFQDFMRVQALNSANEQIMKNIPAHVLPPTWNSIAETDPFLGGADAMIANRVNQQRNNALMAAWSRELYKAQREQAKTGKQFDLNKIGEDFEKSDVFKAINNTYEYKMRSNIEGRNIRPPKGSLIVNNRNQIGISPGD
jgi:hypothetical protein